MQNDIAQLKIKDLFMGGDSYQIPIYQRNYAWKEKEISQLIQDIADSAKTDKAKDYHIGTLVVFERPNDLKKGVYETIDGQQRLTTLVLLLCSIKRLFPASDTEGFDWFAPQLGFDSRDASTDSIQYLVSDRQLDPRFFSLESPEIYEGYSDCLRAVKRILKDTQISPERFVSYLINKVHILRVSVPPDTDLNHYFEIMNSRGEQLEKHEILKARFLDVLTSEDESLSDSFNLIWEGCANMERYIQYGFEPKQRELLFGSEWNELIPDSLEEVSELLFSNEGFDTQKQGFTLQEILSASQSLQFKGNITVGKNQSDSERFTSPINFQNFLLHVLRVQTKKDVPLDDKRLLQSFENELKKKKTERVQFAKEFGFNLLKAKFLFDKYVIKREYINDQDGWSLKRLVRTTGTNVKYKNSFGEEELAEDRNKYNQKILMLLSMFHVSAPTQIYKHWLSGVLKYLMETEELRPRNYRNFLESLGKAFLFDRYLAKEGMRREFYDIIFRGEVAHQNSYTERVEWEYLNRGTDVENFIFNFLDYLIWKNKLIENREKFEFSFRSSVEHYYPQNPREGFQKLDPSISDHFGNLCLISSGINSSLSHDMPSSKKERYKARPSEDSLKQRLMMDYPKWDKEQILEHGHKMRFLLMEQLNS